MDKPGGSGAAAGAKRPGPPAPAHAGSNGLSKRNPSWEITGVAAYRIEPKQAPNHSRECMRLSWSQVRDLARASGVWLLVFGCWFLVISSWLLVPGFLAIGYLLSAI